MHWSRMRKYRVLASKGFIQNLQYTASHLVNSVASAIFGVLEVFLWLSVTPVEGFGVYTPQIMVYYATVNQVFFWFTQFGVKIHAKIRDAVRSGNIATELMRPVDFFTYRAATEYGWMIYGLLFRGVPVGLMLSSLGFYFPRQPVTWMWTLLALLFGAYITITNMYLVGLTAFWTTEIRTAYWVMSSLSLGLGGAAVPLEVLPEALARIARWSPFACLNYNPARIYLELSGPELILPGVVWAVILTAVAQAATAIARRKLEVQGG